MLISNLIENSNMSNVMSLDECMYELTINSMMFDNKLLEAENKLMETQMTALNNIMSSGGTLLENVANLQIIQEGALGNFLTSIKNMLIAIAKKIKEIWNSIFKSEKKSSKDVSTSVSKYNSSIQATVTKTKNPANASRLEKMIDLEVSVKILNMEEVKSKFKLENAESAVKQCLIKFDNIDKPDKENLDDCLLDSIDEFADKIGISNGNFSETSIKDDIRDNLLKDIQFGLNDSDKISKMLYSNSEAINVLEDKSIDIIGKFLCAELDRLPTNRYIRDTSRSMNSDDSNPVIKYKSQFISRAASMVNNIINAIIRTHVANKKDVSSAQLAFSKKMLVAVSGEDALKKHEDEWKKLMEDPNYVLVI